MSGDLKSNQRLIRAFTGLNLLLVLMAAALVLSSEEKPLAPSAAAAPQAQLQIKRSPIEGIIDLYWQDQLVQNLVPLVRWSSARGDQYNSAEIQEAGITISQLAEGYLVSYEPFDQEEHVDGAAPQPASEVKMSLLVRPQGNGLSITPILEQNPRQLHLEFGIGHFFGVHHGTGSVSIVQADGEFEFQPEPRRTQADIFSMGKWVRFSGVSGAQLHSHRQGMPDLRMELARGTGELHLEVRDEPWVPQLAARRGLDQWVEATIVYAPLNHYPLNLQAIH